MSHGAQITQEVIQQVEPATTASRAVGSGGWIGSSLVDREMNIRITVFSIQAFLVGFAVVQYLRLRRIEKEWEQHLKDRGY